MQHIFNEISLAHKRGDIFGGITAAVIAGCSADERRLRARFGTH